MVSAYDTLRGALMRHKATVRLPGRLGEDELRRLLDRLALDDPELFFVEGLCASPPLFGTGGTLVEPLYRFDAPTAQRLAQAMADVADEAMRRVRNTGGFSAVRALHDWLISRFSYRELPDGCAHLAVGPLLMGGGVCEGMAKAFKYLCDRANIPCLVATGTSRDPARGDAWEPHAWNLVQLAGEDECASWYHVDATYDAALATSVARYDYLCLGDDDASLDHRPDEGAALPPCPRSWGCYRRVGRFASGLAELDAIVRQAKRAGENPLVFQTPRIEGLAAFVEASATAIGAELAPHARGRQRIVLTRNLAQMVFQIDVLPEP